MAIWVEKQQQMAKKKDVRFCEELLTIPDLTTLSYEEIISFINYISLDLINLLKEGT